MPASGLTGATLAAGVTASSLTSVGTLTSLGVAGAVTTTTADSTSGLFIKGATNLLRVNPQAAGLSVEATTANQGAFAPLFLDGSTVAIQTNGTTSALAFDVSQNGTFGGGMTNTHITTGTNADFLCLSAGGVFLLQTSACTISSMRFKNWLGDVSSSDALRDVFRLKPIAFTMKEDAQHPNPDRNYPRPQIGLSAENVAEVMPLCAIYEDDGTTPKSYRQECVIAQLVGAVNQLAAGR